MVRREPQGVDAGLELAMSALASASVRPIAVRAGLGATAVSVVVEFAQAEASLPEWSGGAAADVRIVGPDGADVAAGAGKIEPGSRAVLIEVLVPGTVPQGPLRAVVALRGRASVVEESVSVAAGGTWLGPPRAFLTGSSPRSPRRPVATREFSRQDRVVLEWPLIQAATYRSARLLRRSGDAIRFVPQVTDTTVSGGPGLTLALPPGLLGPGEYAVELVVGAGNDAERSIIAFRVV
jgi:hypothetical protein